MPLTYIIDTLSVLLALITLALMTWSYQKTKQTQQALALTPKKTASFSLLAVIAYFADTLGIGSFPVVIAGCQVAKLIPDGWLPGLTNGGQVIPGIIESILFIHYIPVEPHLLLALVIPACIGGVTGGLIVSRLNQHYIQLSMLAAFALLAIALFCNQVGWLHFAGTATHLSTTKLIIGAIGMLIAGMLTCIGVGIYAVIEILLLLLGVSPLIAFPIMTTAGALQQSFATSTLTIMHKVPLKQALLMTFVGIIGVLLALPLVRHMTANKLHWLLLIIIVYNCIMLFLSLRKKKT